MSDKSVWQGLGNLMGGKGKPSVKPLPTSTRRCEAGHPMALDWTKCPYCEAARNAGEKTRINDDDAPTFGPSAGSAAPPRAGAGATRINDPEPDSYASAGAAPPDRGATRIHRPTMADPMVSPEYSAPQREPAPMSAGGGSQRGSTRVFDMGEQSSPQAQRRPGGGRRLTGIVVTFTWSPLGQLYQVQEGRNFGGSGTVSAEGQRDADILVTEDATMSSAHFLILCQGGKYRISDCNSTNGTYVNGELIDALGIVLPDDALIQAGATLMTFKKVLPPTGVPVAADKPEPPAAPPPHGQHGSHRPPPGDGEDELV